MKLTDVVTKNVIRHLINGRDYRVEILALINADFLQYTLDFFAKVVAAKLKNKDIDIDWYRAEFLSPTLPSDELIINSGLNKKTIENSYGSSRRDIVLDVTIEHYETLLQAIETLIANSGDIDATLILKFKGVAVDLSLNETLIVVNTLAVKRAQIRGGAWSTAGKQVEKRLMITLCKLFNVSSHYYELTGLSDQNREIDFYLIDHLGKKHGCEVKLMGKGNPESADAVIARDSQIFIADTLSDLNRRQLTALGLHWVEMYRQNGYKKFFDILQALGIPSQDFEGDVNERLEIIFNSLFTDTPESK